MCTGPSRRASSRPPRWSPNAIPRNSRRSSRGRARAARASTASGILRDRMKLAYTISASPTRFAAVAQGRGVAASIRQLAGLGYHGVELAIRDPAAVNVDEIAEAVRQADL